MAAGTYRGGAAEAAADPQEAVNSKTKESNKIAVERQRDIGVNKRGADATPPRKRQLRYAGRDFDDWRSQLLNDLEQNTRVKAIEALESFGKNGYGEEAAEAIGQALPSDDDHVSLSAASALGAIGPPALPVLIEALKNDRASCRRNAAIAIGRMGPVAVASADALSTLCKGDDRGVRRAAAEALARIAYQSDALTPLLGRLVADDDSSTRYGVVQGLAGMLSTSPRPLSLLLIASRDPDSNIRITAAKALAQHGPPTDEVIEALKRLVHDPKGQVGVNAVIALSQAPDRDLTVVPVLADVLLSLDLMEQLSKIGVSERVIEKLRNPGDAAAIAVPALAKYIEPGFDPQKIGRVVKAIDALGELGPAAKDAIPALEAWTNGKRGVYFNNGDSVEKHARRALEKIKGDPGGTTETDAEAGQP